MVPKFRPSYLHGIVLIHFFSDKMLYWLLCSIPSKLMQTKDTQQELMNYFQNYIVTALDKAVAIDAIAKLLDSFCVKGSVFLISLLLLHIFNIIY